MSDSVEPRSKVGYEKGFYIEQGVNSLAVQGRVQVRFTHISAEGAPNEDAFSIPRARLTLHGTLFQPELSYKFQADFGKGSASLKDFYLDYCIAQHLLCVRPGQFKRPYSRQQITSSGSQEFVDRALTDKAFDAGRDIGIMIHDNYEKSPEFEYALGLFNGSGEKSSFSGAGTADLDSGEVEIDSGKFSNVPHLWQPMLVARVGFNYGGIKGYSEADLEGGSPRFGVAGSLATRFDADQSDDSLLNGEVDFILKAYGFSVSGAVYHESEQDGSGFWDRANGDGGAHFQIGYVIADRYQPTLRYAIVDPRHQGANDIQEEYALGLNVYMEKHHLKWQNDLALLRQAEDDTQDVQVRSQLQLAF